jgi:hypothetical protein
MAARAKTKGIDKSVIETGVVPNGVTIPEGVGVKFTANPGEITVAVAGDAAVGVALETVVGDGKKTIQFVALTGGAVVKVKVTTGPIAAGAYLECAAGGFAARTLGGGTVLRNICGTAWEAGATGDFIGMLVGKFAGVSA